MTISTKILNRNFSFMLTLIALSFWLISLFQTSPANISDIGLITALPITFFIAIILLTVSFLISLKSEDKNQKLLFLQVLILVCFLSLTPTLVEGTRARYSYPTYGFIDYIIRNGQLNPALVYYHNWPGIIIVFTGLVTIGGVTPQALINSFPIVPELLYFMPVLLFATLFIKNIEQKWMAIWLFYVISWAGQDFLNSQAFEFFIFLIVISVLFLEANNDPNKPKARGFTVLIVLLFFSVVIGHYLTALMLVGIMSVLFVSKRIKNVNLVLLSIVIVIAWTIYGATAYFNSNVSSFLSSALNFNLILNGNISQRVTGSLGHLISVYERIAYTAIILCLAFTGILLAWKSKKLNKTDRTSLITLVAIGLFAFIFPYGGELYIRLLLFSSILLAYFISKNLDSKKMFALLTIFLFLAPPLYVVATYGGEKFDYISPGELQGAKFFETHVPNGYVITGSGGATWAEYLGAYDHYSYIELQYGNLLASENYAYMQRISLNQYWPIYLMFTSGDEAYFSLYNNNPTFINQTEAQIQNSPRYNLFYSSPNMQLYTYNPNK